MDDVVGGGWWEQFCGWGPVKKVGVMLPALLRAVAGAGDSALDGEDVGVIAGFLRSREVSFWRK